jgi:hypothetical protein
MVIAITGSETAKPGGTRASIVTFEWALDMDIWLRISFEFYVHNTS